MNVPGAIAPLYIRIECSSQLLIVAHSTIDRPLNDWSVSHVSAVFTGSDWILISTMWRVWTLIHVPACLKSSDGFQVIGFWECSFHWWQDGGGYMIVTENPCCMMGHRGIDQQTVTWFSSADHGKAPKRPASVSGAQGLCPVFGLMEAKAAIRRHCPAFVALPVKFNIG